MEQLGIGPPLVSGARGGRPSCSPSGPALMALALAPHLSRALRLVPSPSAAATALLASASPLPLHQFLQLHAHLLRTGVLVLAPAPAPAPASAFLSLAVASLPSLRALAVLHQHLTPASVPSTFCCNSILRSLSESDGLSFLRRMRSVGRRGNAFSLAILLKPCCTLAHARQLHANVVAEGHLQDALLATSLMRSYMNCGAAESVCKVFDEMLVKDTVAWNVLITCYARNKRTKDTLKLFDEMRSESEAEPDEVTCILLLQACTSLGALDFGEQIWEYAMEHGYGCELKVRNSLITMYTRCGCVQKAYEVFCGTPRKSVVTWSAMISGLAANGFGKDAISAFEEMSKSGVAPDAQTFTGVLSACSHSGLVDEGFSSVGSVQRPKAAWLLQRLAAAHARAREPAPARPAAHRRGPAAPAPGQPAWPGTAAQHACHPPAARTERSRPSVTVALDRTADRASRRYKSPPVAARP
uniref:Uncharacterized protein n=1 Tax=Avena sativa TaxID=4498 RepID=A0ACD5ZPS3_AVESA